MSPLHSDKASKNSKREKKLISMGKILISSKKMIDMKT